jgi:hypothetical protein
MTVVETVPATAFNVAAAGCAIFPAMGRARFVCQPEASQRHTTQAGTEFLERLPPGGGLGQSLGQFIEFVVHTCPFCLLFFTRFLFAIGVHKQLRNGERKTDNRPWVEIRTATYRLRAEPYYLVKIGYELTELCGFSLERRRSQWKSVT